MTGEIVSVGTLRKMAGEEENEAAVFKLAYRLKNAGVLVPIRNGVYFAGDGKLKTPSDVLDGTYWKIVAHLCRNADGKNAFISGNAAMQLLLKNHKIPDELVLTAKTERRTV